MAEHTKALKWREKRELSRERLSELTGYSPVTIWWMEQGLVPPKRNAKSGSESREIKPWVWHRYKRACGDVDAEINGRKKGEIFKW